MQFTLRSLLLFVSLCAVAPPVVSDVVRHPASVALGIGLNSAPWTGARGEEFSALAWTAGAAFTLGNLVGQPATAFIFWPVRRKRRVR